MNPSRRRGKRQLAGPGTSERRPSPTEAPVIPRPCVQRAKWAPWANLAYGDILFVLLLVAMDLYVFGVATRLAWGPTAVYHDNYELGYTARVLISTAIRNGTFPFWDHWTHGGAPLCTLYTSVNFSPLVILLSLFSGVYSVHTFILEIVVIHLVGLLGMYSWLRGYCDRYPAVIGAVSFAMSSHLIDQASISFEGVVSASMFPWLALGARYALAQKVRGIPIIAISAWEMFTAGYLGVNIIAVQFIGLFCLIEFFVTGREGFCPPKRFLRGLLFAISGVVVWALILNFHWLEMFSYYRLDLTQLRQQAVNPYTGTARLDSLIMWMFPNFLSPHWADAFGGHRALLFSGTLCVLFSLYALVSCWRKPVVALLTLFAAVAFVSMLSKEWRLGRFFTEHILFYDKVQFHVWNSAMCAFYLCALAAIGAGRFLSREEPVKKTLALGALVGLAILCLAWRAHEGEAIRTFLFFPQIFFLAFFVAYCVVGFRFDSAVSIRMNAKFVVLLSLVEFLCVSGQLVHHVNIHASLESVKADNERVKTADFPPPSNRRLDTAPLLNGQYFTKQPAIEGYQPNCHPTMTRIINAGEGSRLLGSILYPADTNGYPRLDAAERITIVAFTPSHVEAMVRLAADAPSFVWSSPFTPNWKLSVDGVRHETERNRFGLTAFSLKKGEHTIDFLYRPSYLPASIVAAVLGILLAVGLLAWDIISRCAEIGMLWRELVGLGEGPVGSPKAASQVLSEAAHSRISASDRRLK